MAPLEGVRILAVEVYGAGPFGSAHLADLGAEVIKIEPPGGCASRRTPPSRASWIRARREGNVQDFLRLWLKDVKPKGSIHMGVDVDPYNFL